MHVTQTKWHIFHNWWRFSSFTDEILFSLHFTVLLILVDMKSKHQPLSIQDWIRYLIELVISIESVELIIRQTFGPFRKPENRWCTKTDSFITTVFKIHMRSKSDSVVTRREKNNFCPFSISFCFEYKSPVKT